MPAYGISFAILPLAKTSKIDRKTQTSILANNSKMLHFIALRELQVSAHANVVWGAYLPFVSELPIDVIIENFIAALDRDE